jgi:hypothetical protein
LVAQIRDAQEGAKAELSGRIGGTLFDKFMKNPFCPLADQPICFG